MTYWVWVLMLSINYQLFGADESFYGIIKSDLLTAKKDMDAIKKFTED